MSSRPRIVSLCRDGPDPLRPLETSIWNIHSGTRWHQNGNSTRHRHVSERHLTQRVVAILNSRRSYSTTIAFMP